MMDSSPSVSSPNESFIKHAFRLAGRAMLLQKSAFEPVLAAEKPRRYGFKILLVIAVTVAIFQAIGSLFDYWTMPQLPKIQAGLYEVITAVTQSRRGEDPSGLFNLLYRTGWLLVYMQTGYPLKSGVVWGFLGSIIGPIFNWFTYAIFAHWVMRAVKGKVTAKQIYGIVGLAFAPYLLYVLTVIPGVVLPPTLVSWWIMAAMYQGISAAAPELTWKRKVLVVVLPYFIAILFMIGALVGGVWLGVTIAGWMSG
jgi:hypothetical protein